LVRDAAGVGFGYRQPKNAGFDAKAVGCRLQPATPDAAPVSPPTIDSGASACI